MQDEKKDLSGLDLGRRTFICRSAMLCGLLSFAAAGGAQAAENKSKTIKTVDNPAELVTCCGLYCGACDIYQEKIGHSGRDLMTLLKAYKFHEFATQVPGLEEYDKFETVLENLIAIFGQCLTCKNGGGIPECPIRSCCAEKGYQTCAECPSLPCEKVNIILDGYPLAEKNLSDIQRMGVEKWAGQQQEKVKKGFSNLDSLLDES